MLLPCVNAGVNFAIGNEWSSMDARFRRASNDAGDFTVTVDNPGAVATLGAGLTLMAGGNLSLALMAVRWTARKTAALRVQSTLFAFSSPASPSLSSRSATESTTIFGRKG